MNAATVKVQFESAGAGQVKGDLKDVGQGVDSVGKSGGRTGGILSTAFGVFGGNLITGVVGKLGGFVTGLVDAQASAEAYRNQLNIAVGDTKQAGQIFDFVKSMAANTPFEFPELIQSAANLEALGQSAEKWLPIIGDTAAATNKSVDQVTQAVLDAQTGEFERLKEFGIRAKAEGDKVKFTYMKNGKEMVVEADNTAEGISNALMGIWSDKYTGAMETMAQSWIGQMSTLKDNIRNIAMAMTKPLFDGAKKGIEFANNFLGPFFSMLQQGVNPAEAFKIAMRAALWDTFGEDTANRLQGITKTIGNMLGVAMDVGTGLVKLFTGDFSGAMLAFGKAAQGAWDILRGIGLAVADLAMDVLDWTINTGIPTVAGWLADHAGDIWGGVKAIVGWTGSMVADLATWTLNVGIPTLAMAYVSYQVLITKAIGQVIVDLAQWTLRVGAPRVTIEGWNTVDLLLTAMNQQIIVPLNDWMLTLSAPEVILAAGSVAQWIGDKVRGGGPAKIEAIAQILPILTSPVAIPALVTAYIISKMPDTVKTTIATTLVNTFKLIQTGGSLVGQVSQYVFNSLVGVTFKAIALVSVGVSLTIQGWSDTLAKFFQSLADSVINADWSIDIPKPDIDWPDPMDWVPQDVKDFFTDPIGYITGQTSGGSGKGKGVGSEAVGQSAYAAALAAWKWEPGGGKTPQRLGNIDNIGGAPMHGQQVTITAVDMATPTIAAVKAALISIPPEKLSQLRQAGGEVVSAVAGIAKGAIERVPTNWLSALRQQGGEQVTATAGTTRGAIMQIPREWLSNLRQAGASAVQGAAYGAANAIRSVPTYWSTTFSSAGAGAVQAAANAVANAIANIPSSKTVVINTVQGGARAIGGYVDGMITRLAELGPELVALPKGGWMLANRDGLYPTPMGSYVYTAAQTRDMMGNLQPVPAYADGGMVGGGTRPMLAPVADSGRGDRFSFFIIDPSFLRELPDLVTSARTLSNPDELRAILGGA